MENLTAEAQAEVLEVVQHYCYNVKHFRAAEKSFLNIAKFELSKNTIDKDAIFEALEDMEALVMDPLYFAEQDIQELVRKYNLDSAYLLGVQVLSNLLNNTSYNCEFSENDTSLKPESSKLFAKIKKILKG